MIPAVRLAVRRLARAPLYSLSVCVVLALAGAALTAAGAAAYAVLLAPLPYDAPKELVFLERHGLKDGDRGPFSPADFLDFRNRTTTLDFLTAAESWSPVITGDGAATRLRALRATGDLFQLLRLGPALGRMFEANDDQAGSAKVAVISHRLWRRSFGADPAAVGRALRLDGETYTLIGVAPEGFEFPTFWNTGVDIWTPLQWSTREASRRNASSLRVFGRLADGATIDAARAEAETIAAQMRAAFPKSHANRGVALTGIHDATVREVRPILLALASGAALLWLIALSNLTALAVVRATRRTTEAAVRRALGESNAAGFGRDALESGLLALTGSTIGVLLGFSAIRMLTASAPGELGFLLSDWRELPISLWAAGGIFAPSLASAAMLALAGRWAYSGARLVDALRSRTEAGASRRSSLLRGALTGGEIALAVVLVAAAGLVGRSLLELLSVDPGFKPDRVTTAVVPVTGSTFGDPARKAGFYRELVNRLRNTPGVESAAAVNHAPLVGDHWGASFSVEGEPPAEPGSEPNATYRVATPGYIDTIGARLVAGRDFTEADDRDAPGVVIVNQAFVDRYLRGAAAPLRARIRLGGPESTEPWRSVVGVIADLRQRDWAQNDAELFLPFEQDQPFRASPRAPFAMTIVARSSGDVSIVPTLRRIVADLDPLIPVDRVVTLEEAVDDALWQPRLAATLLGGFSFIALLLAGVGVYGTAAQTVAARRSEIGLRMALGATGRDVLAETLGRNARFVAGGIAAGLAVSWMAAGLLRDLLYQVDARDGLVLSGACLVLAATGLIAGYGPARRAALTDPATALRQE